MTLPFKPHVLALICSAGIFAASGVVYVQSRSPAAAPTEQTAPVAASAAAPAAPEAAPVYTQAQIDQWVAPVALFPDPLLSQVLMASTYPSAVVQAVQWSQDHPSLQGDPAVQAVANQPWDASVKSLVAFPALTSLMGEDPQWVENLGNAFLAQPQEVMDSVQRLRALAQQTGALKSSPQQTVTTTPKAVTTAPPAVKASAPAAAPVATQPSVIKIAPTDPNTVYVPTYNPNQVYGTWPNSAYPPVYLPPTPGEQFSNSYMKGLGYSLGVATTWALFSSIDWDDDHHDHHDDHHDDHHQDDHGGYNHNGANININVHNFNQVTGEHLNGDHMNWQHNPAYRNGVPYPDKALTDKFHQSHAPSGLSATARPAVAAAATNKDSQREAARAELQQRTHGNTGVVGNASHTLDIHSVQRDAASKQLHQIAQRDNYRGYDKPAVSHPKTITHSSAHTAAQNKVQQHTANPPSGNVASHQVNKEAIHNKAQTVAQHHSQTSTSRPGVQNHSFSGNALSGNDHRAPTWQAQQQRGQQSRQLSGISHEQQRATKAQVSEHHPRLRH